MVILQRSSRVCVYENLHLLIKSVSVGKLKEYFERGFLQPLLSLPNVTGSEYEECLADSICSVRGLGRALHVREHPKSVTLLLYQTLETVYQCVPTGKPLVIIKH